MHCFQCRKSFKRISREEMIVCPHCAGNAVEMGRNFRAPKQRDLVQWEKVRILYDGGIRFSGTQSYRLGRFPETCHEAIEFVRKNRPAYL